ncbi:C1QL4-like protein, partial [Mya arenaria]
MQLFKQLKGAVDGELVAFHAYMENGKCFQSHEIIVFDHIITNTVAAYDNSDGIFTAPTTGIYVFIWNFSSSTSSLNVMELVVHGVVVGASMSDSEHSTDYHPAAGFAIIHVNAGERVFVRKTRQAGHSC